AVILRGVPTWPAHEYDPTSIVGREGAHGGYAAVGDRVATPGTRHLNEPPPPGERSRAGERLDQRGFAAAH
ncbi:MAG: hypothetical protein ACO3UW_10070, partial [Candidatus Nanopelagicales bacterium]